MDSLTMTDAFNHLVPFSIKPFYALTNH